MPSLFTVTSGSHTEMSSSFPAPTCMYYEVMTLRMLMPQKQPVRENAGSFLFLPVYNLHEGGQGAFKIMGGLILSVCLFPEL